MIDRREFLMALLAVPVAFRVPDLPVPFPEPEAAGSSEVITEVIDEVWSGAKIVTDPMCDRDRVYLVGLPKLVGSSGVLNVSPEELLAMNPRWEWENLE